MLPVACGGSTEDTTTRAATDGPATTTEAAPPACSPADVGDCTLRQAADVSGVRIGAAVDAATLRDVPAHGERAAREFNSVTPENDMKWSVTRPTPDTWDWRGADEVVAFAEASGQQVRGHTLVWGQAAGNGMPAWLRDLRDPDAFRTAVVDGITTQVGRYAGRVDRWDVVNEPLAVAGSTLDANPYLERLGPGHIDLAFRTARAADPSAELWLNENLTEYLPAKADALVELVRTLRARGTPIDGVGLQTHLTLDAPLRAGAVGEVVRRLRELGVEVAVTELDVPLGVDRDETEQARLVTQVVDECLAAGCGEVTVWGVNVAA